MRAIQLPFHFRATTVGNTELRLADVRQAMSNGSHIVIAALGIEQQCVEIISHYFYPLLCPLQDKMKEWLLETNWCSFESKRTLIFRVADDAAIFTREERQRFEETFARVIEWRNAFAHGRIHQDHDEIFVSYFRGGPQKKALTDDFWHSAEQSIRGCDEFVNRLFGEICIRRSEAAQKMANQMPQPTGPSGPVAER